MAVGDCEWTCLSVVFVFIHRQCHLNFSYLSIFYIHSQSLNRPNASKSLSINVLPLSPNSLSYFQQLNQHGERRLWCMNSGLYLPSRYFLYSHSKISHSNSISSQLVGLKKFVFLFSSFFLFLFHSRHTEGPPTVFGCALNYVVMRLLGVPSHDPELLQSSKFIERIG